MDTTTIQKTLLITLDDATGSVLFQKALEFFAHYFDYVHIVIFSPQPFMKPRDIRHPHPRVSVYTVSSFPLFRSYCFATIRDTYMTQSHVPTHVLAFGSGFHTVKAGNIAHKMAIPFSLKIGFQDTISFTNMLLYRRATHIFVEGGEKLKKLAPYSTAIIPMPPFIDFDSMRSTLVAPILFNKKYKKDFFIMTTLDTYDSAAVELVCRIMERIHTRYIQGGWIIFAPYKDMKRIKPLIPHSLRGCVFVEPVHADMAPIYKGARLYVHTASFDEVSMSVLSALAMGIPVVTTPTGYIADIYAQTAYMDYVIAQHDTDLFCDKIIYLMEKDFATNDYKMNTQTILNNFPRITAEDYYKKMAEVMLQ